MNSIVNIAVKVDATGKTLRFKGRDAFALAALIDAGPKGVTPLEYVGPRWSGYVLNLRKAGLAIETVHESHGGPYAGRHGRYVLRSALTELARRDAKGGKEAA